ncbi:phage tail tape measure protein [Ligilactobacillus agilis]|uniref:phage tail tape measure protein n=1 Tax=Ligilactobacillus agilis TaxID=1601 RepID=UPI001CDC4A41|nr:phage tail tape measure protein [Ligilactobacillus agilis]
MAVGKPLGSMIVTLGLDAAKFTDGLKSAQNQMKLANSEMKANLAAIAATGTEYDKASAKVDSLSKVMEANQRRIDALREAYDKQVKTQGEYSNAAVRTASRINDAVRLQASYERQLQSARVALNEATRGTNDLRQSLDALERTTRATVSGLQAQNKTNQANLAQYRGLKQALQQYNQLLEAEEAKLKDLINLKGKDAQETRTQSVQVAELRSKMQQSQAQFDSLSDKYGKMSTAQAIARDRGAKFKSEMTDLGDKVSKTGEKLKGFSTIAGFGLAAGLKVSIDSLAELKNTLNEIKNLAVTGGESVSEATKNVAKIQKDALEYSNKYGVSINKITDGYEDLIKRGYTTEQALGAMKSELQASLASGDDFNDVVTVSSQTLEAFGMKVNNTAGMLKNTKIVTNELAYAADATSTGFSELGIGMSYVGSTAHTAHIALSETASAMGVLSNNGLEAEKAGTGLRNVINNLVNGVKKIDDKDSVLNKLGVTRDELVDSEGHLRNLSDVFEVLNSKMKGMQPVERAAIFKSLFGTTGQQAGIILADNVKELDELNKKVKEAPKNNYIGALSEKNLKSAQNQLKIFKESASNAGMALAEVLLPSISRVAAQLSKMMQWVAGLPAPMRTLISVTTLFAVAIGPLTIALGALIKSIGLIGAALSALSLGALLNPITLTIAAIAALGVGFTLAYKNIKPFRDTVNGVIKTIKNLWTVLTQGKDSKSKAQANLDLAQIFPQGALIKINQLGNNLQSVAKKIRTAIQAIKDTFTIFTKGDNSKTKANAYTNLLNILPQSKAQTLINTANNIKKAFQGMFAVIKGQNKQGSNLLADVFPKPLVTFITTTIKILKADFKSLGNTISSVFGAIGKTLGTVFGSIGSSFLKLLKSLFSWFGKYGPDLLAAFRNIFGLIAGVVAVKFTAILTTATVIMKVLGTVIKGALDVIRNVFSAVWGSIENIVGGVLKAIGGIFEVFAGAFTGNWKLVWQGVKDIFSGIWNSFKGIVGGVINVIIGIVNSGIDGINWILSKFNAKKVGHISPVKWATGTTRYYPSGLPETQLAMVNDGGKREAIVYPNGQIGMFRDMNVTTILPKGSHVINGDDTERLGLGANPVTHYYAKGTVDFSKIWNGIKSGASKLWDDLTDGLKFAKNIIAHPIKALQGAFESHLNLGGQTSFVIDTVKGIGSFIVNAIKNGVVSEIKKWIGENEASSDATSPKPTGDHKHWMKQAGIPESWFSLVNWIVTRESGWNPKATNPSSGAYGLPQSLPGNKMASAGKDWRTNPITQLKWMYSYIKGRYGNAANAQRFWQAHHWYANGGFVTQEQIAHIAEGNRPEAIIPLTNRTRAMQILTQVRDKYGLSAGNVVLSGGEQDNTDLSSFERKFDTVISLLGQIAGLGAEQVNALKVMKPSQNFDKNKFYQDMFRDQTISNYMNM